MQRRKGGDGEREIAALVRDLTGWDVRRRVRQHEGDSDVEGIPGWCCEVKRHARATRGDIARWWQQTARQAAAAGLRPLLFYRLDRDCWRALWPVAVLADAPVADGWRDYDMTCEGSVSAWAAVARERESATLETTA